jgi:hypothetical protein
LDDQQLLDEMVQAAARLGVSVRLELFETPALVGGGRCILRGEPLVLIDQRAPLPDQVRVLARALSGLATETVYMAPAARALIEEASAPA